MTAHALHLLRHGAVTQPGRLIGRTDDEPTADGIAACVAQAEDLGFTHLVASNLRRSRAAGEAIATVAGTVLSIDERWRELDFGDWDGLPVSAINTGAIGRFWDDPDANPPPNGERWTALVARIGDAIASLPPEPTLVVTHGGTIRAALHRLCGFAQPQLWAFDLPCGVLVSLRIWPGEHPTAQIVGIRP